MEERSVIHSTFVIERNYPSSVEQVFAAFADPKKKRRWFVEGDGFNVRKFEMDFRVGGREHSQFTGGEDPVKGATFTNETVFQDIVPNRRIVFAYTMAMNEKRISASLVTVELESQGKDTKLVFTEQGAFFEGADGPQMREQGWKELLGRLSKELEQ
jgi:uncharacterized protein YndB with AHSA1/START domain